MSGYLLIESRDPFDSNDVTHCCGLASGLASEGHEVTLFFVQNGVLPARPGKRSEGLSLTAGAGVRILADEFSLRERGIRSDQLLDGVQAAPRDVVIDHLSSGSKAIWH
ncbi:MAG: DsrE family protein [Planctomycetota bacterium]